MAWHVQTLWWWRHGILAYIKWHMTCYQPPLRSTSYCKTVRRRDVTSRRRRLQWCWTSSIRDETSPTGTQCCRAWSTTNRTRRTRHPSRERWPSAWVSSWWHWVSVIIMHSLRVLITLFNRCQFASHKHSCCSQLSAWPRIFRGDKRTRKRQWYIISAHMVGAGAGQSKSLSIDF